MSSRHNTHTIDEFLCISRHRPRSLRVAAFQETPTSCTLHLYNPWSVFSTVIVPVGQRIVTLPKMLALMISTKLYPYPQNGRMLGLHFDLTSPHTLVASSDLLASVFLLSLSKNPVFSLLVPEYFFTDSGERTVLSDLCRTC